MTLESFSKGALTFIRATNASGLSVTLCDFGAAIYEIRFKGRAMTIAEKDLEEWKASSSYFGKTVGRMAGRIPNGDLDYLGKHHKVDANDGTNCLHGGKEGFSFLPFKMDVVHLGNGVSVDYYLVSKAGAMGFPGEVDLRVRYFIPENESSLKITYEMKSSEQTPLNITCHAYFNLGGDATVENQKLYVKAEETEHYDEHLAPLGFQKSPECLNFLTPKAVGRDIGDPFLQKSKTLGYDHCFLLENHDPKEAIATLESPVAKMSLFTDYPALQIYSDNYPRLTHLLNTGMKEGLHAGLAIEPVFKPKDFRGMTVLPYETKKMWIEYVFTSKEA
jgi:aldose 1-epimerase